MGRPRPPATAGLGFRGERTSFPNTPFRSLHWVCEVRRAKPQGCATAMTHRQSNYGEDRRSTQTAEPCLRALARTSNVASGSFLPRAAPLRFDSSPVPLGLNHPRLLPPGLRPLLTQTSLELVLPRRRCRALALFQLRAQIIPGQFPIRRLGTLALAANLRPGRSMTQPHARRTLVNLLAARSRPPDKTFVNVRAARPERVQPGFDLVVHAIRLK